MSDNIKDIINELEGISPLVAGIPRNRVLTVPEHYFENLASHILIKINKEKSDLPEGYFDSLPDRIMERIRQEKPVVAIGIRTYFMRYAVAAVLTGLLGLALFSLFNKPAEVDPVYYAEAGKILKKGNFDAVMNSLDEKEIEGFLEAGGLDVQAALVAHAAYSKELPEEIDYLSNENTLDDFLKELNIESSDK